MQPNSVVIVSLHSPKEKFWGQVVEVSTAGVTLRGVDLSSFDDFLRGAMFVMCILHSSLLQKYRLFRREISHVRVPPR